MFGFTGTPIFEENATYIQATGEQAQYKTTNDVFQKELHSYTITNAIEDRNVLRFHIDYFKPDDNNAFNNENTRKRAVVEAIIKKHRSATSNCRFNAIFATASINDAIEYYHLLKAEQNDNEEAETLNIACVFSPPAEGDKDIMQIQEDLNQERMDNEVDPDKKKEALKSIIDQYNGQYGTNHSVNEFDAYYQDVQQRIKNQKYSNKDYAHKNKIDITIVVDMLLTGFDSKYLNTLYVDKNLKYHGLIQAFSRTNRILNDTKPYGNILDFRGQQNAVDAAIALFSGKKDADRARQIWLVEPVESINKKYKDAVAKLRQFMRLQDLEFKASEVANLRGDEARAGFINCFKEVQRYKTQLDQYTDAINPNEERTNIFSDPQASYGFTDDDLRAFRGAYLDLACSLKNKRERRSESVSPEVEDLDFEFVLFASSLIDYDYIMELIARYAGTPLKTKMTKEQLIGLVSSTSNLLDEREDIIAYIDSLDGVKGKTEQEIKDGYEIFKEKKFSEEIIAIADKHGLSAASLQNFVDGIVERRIFDGEKLSELIEPLGLGWKDRTRKETAIMSDLVPLLKHITGGQKISGLSAYDKK